MTLPSTSGVEAGGAGSIVKLQLRAFLAVLREAWHHHGICTRGAGVAEVRSRKHTQKSAEASGSEKSGCMLALGTPLVLPLPAPHLRPLATKAVAGFRVQVSDKVLVYHMLQWLGLVMKSRPAA